MRFKIALNAGDVANPPWRVIDEDGKSFYFNKITFRGSITTLAEKSREVAYKGWIVAEGDLIVDAVHNEAVVKCYD